MKVKLMITSNLDTLFELRHRGYIGDEVVLPWTLTAPTSQLNSREKRQEATAEWLADCNADTVNICYHSSILATIGAGFESVVAKVGDSERVVARYPSISHFDLLRLLLGSVKLTADDSFEFWYLSQYKEDVQVKCEAGVYQIDTRSFLSPCDLAEFIGASKYMQSTYAQDGVPMLRHEFVDISGRLWIYNTVETHTVESVNVPFTPDSWGARINFTTEEILNG